MSIDLMKGVGVEANRRRHTFRADKSGSYVSTNLETIRIEMKVSKETLDFETGYLLFDMVGASANTPSFLPFAAGSWIKNMRVYDAAGRQIGDQIKYYNAMYRKKMELLGNEGANANYLAVTEGANETSAGLGTAATSREYAHKFITHIFDLKSYFPAHKIGGLVLELDMAPVKEVLTDSAAGALTSYTLSNVRYVCDMVLLKPEEENKLVKDIENGGLEIHYETSLNNAVPITTNTSQILDLGLATGSVKNIQCFQVLASQQDGTDEDYFGAFAQNNLSAYHVLQGTDYLTEQQVQISSTRLAEYLIEYLKSENLSTEDIIHFYGDSALTLSSFFTIGQKVEVSKAPDVASGVRDNQSNVIKLELTFSSAPAVATLYSNIGMDKVLVIKRDREFENRS